MLNDRTVRRIALVSGWATMALIAFWTLSPIGLRPRVAGIGLEHVGAFATVGLLLGLAYPRRLPQIALFLVVAAVSLELAQHLVPGRHGRVVDALQKVVGGGIGLALALGANASLARLGVVARSGRRG